MSALNSPEAVVATDRMADEVTGTERYGTRRRRKPPFRFSPGKVVLWVLVILFALVFMYPFAWLLAASLKPRGQVFDNRLIPETFVWSNYADVWEQLPLTSWLFNSLAIALLAATTVALSSTMVAFGFAHFRCPGRNALIGLVLGTWAPLWAFNLFGSAFYIFLQRQFLLGLPRELFEAARMDGASYWRIFWRIVMPLSIPSFIIVFLFEFQASWNNLQAALIYLNAGSVEDFTAPLGIAYAMTRYSPTAGGQGDYQYVMVASLIVTLPMLVLFAFGQRYFIEGIATTGRKG